MSRNGRTETNCTKCAQLLFADVIGANGRSEQIYPPLPCLVRIVDPRSNNQIICPTCGHVNRYSSPLGDHVLRVVKPGNHINIMPGTKEDKWGIAKITTNTLSIDVLTSSFQTSVEAFKNNIIRIDGLGTSVVLTAGLSFTAGSKYVQQQLIQDEGGETPPPTLIELFLSHTKLFNNLSQELECDAMKNGKNELKVWILHHRQIQLGIEAMFSSQIVSLWTAIETLAGDLWQASLNSHPRILGDLKGSPKRIARNMRGTRARKQLEEQPDGDGKSVLLSDVRRVTRGSYDLSSTLGTLLRDKFNFTRFDGIREASSSAFSEEFEAIDKALSNTALDAVHIARNVLVHSAGKVDKEYVSRLEGNSLLPVLKLGEMFPLNGNITHSLIKPAVAATVDLISAVDSWVVKHAV
jgi:hypothetical protein